MSINPFHARQGGRQRDKKPVKAPVDHHSPLRADALLVQRGLVASRTSAQQLIDEGRVYTNEKAIAKPMQEPLTTVLEHTGLDVAGRTCLDVRQPTSGFTDCLLRAGVARVVVAEGALLLVKPQFGIDPHNNRQGRHRPRPDAVPRGRGAFLEIANKLWGTANAQLGSNGNRDFFVHLPH